MHLFGNGLALLDMQGIGALAILTINYNTIETQTLSEQISRKKNEAVQTSTNKSGNANTDSSLSDNTIQMVTDKNNIKINYFLPGPR